MENSDNSANTMIPDVAPPVGNSGRKSVPLIILFNLVPVFGTLFLKWNVGAIIFLYWFENIIIGIINIAKLALCQGIPSPEEMKQQGTAGNIINPATTMKILKIFLIPFFTFHYGMFTFVHGVFLVVFFGKQVGLADTDSFPLIGKFLEIFKIPGFPEAVAAIFLSRVIRFAIHYIGEGEYKIKTPPQLMFEPYGQIVVLHLTIIFGGIFAMVTGENRIALLILISLKIAVELRGHLKARNASVELSAGPFKFSLRNRDNKK